MTMTLEEAVRITALLADNTSDCSGVSLLDAAAARERLLAHARATLAAREGEPTFPSGWKWDENGIPLRLSPQERLREEAMVYCGLLPDDAGSEPVAEPDPIDEHYARVFICIADHIDHLTARLAEVTRERDKANAGWGDARCAAETYRLERYDLRVENTALRAQIERVRALTDDYGCGTAEPEMVTITTPNPRALVGAIGYLFAPESPISDPTVTHSVTTEGHSL